MRRKLFNLVAALSLTLLAALCVLWVRSYIVQDSWRGWTTHRGQGVSLTRGRLVVWRTDQATANPSNAMPFGYVSLRPPPDPELYVAYDKSLMDLRLPGLRIVGGVFNGDMTGHQFWLSFGWLAAVLAIVPLFWLRRRMVGRGRPNHCHACGYDLRATPERCPECGALPEPPHNQPMQRTGAAV